MGFFDQHSRNEPSELLTSPSTDYPEVVVVAAQKAETAFNH
jgi:hypothetical protein